MARIIQQSFVLAVAGSLGACGTAPGTVVNADRSAQNAPAIQGTAVTDQQLPISKRFKNLDDYLAWLQLNEAPVDGAWYKEVGPGIYELQTGGNLHLDTPGGGQQRFTRAELERKFGFVR